MSGYNYKVGGSLADNDPTYVIRQADQDLYNELKAGNFCYVLNSRQMGKSSLRIRTMKKLQAEGIGCASIDITIIGSQEVTPEKWYGGITYALSSAFELLSKANFNDWWRQHELLSQTQRLSEFIESVLLAELSQNIVIFIDEIDSILKINFKDDFFAFIRACYNLRVDKPAYNRLTFCLLGVATPSDLMQDKQRTPFNIGRDIELTGFKLDEAKPLTKGLEGKVDNPDKVLKEILNWTGGQPFLTQKLCNLVVEKAKSRNQNIRQLVKKYVIDNWVSQDSPEHLRTISDRLLSNEQRASRLLGLYHKIWEQGKLTADGSLEQTELRLSGLVVKENGNLRVYNRIYKAIFDLNWVTRELEKLRPYSQAITAWLNSNRQDKSRLLRGQALQEALDWAADKSLSAEDYHFLSASQQLALAEAEKDNQILAEAKQKAEQLMREAREGTKIERAGVKAWRQFEAGTSKIRALVEAMHAGQELQKWVKDGRRLQDYPATSPLFALQQILHKIRERNEFSGHEDAVKSVSFSPNGEYIATASYDRTARLWDLSGNQIAEFSGHRGGVMSVSFSPNGEYIATASDDSTARLWDLSGNQIVEFSGHQDGVNSVSFSPNGEYVATASGDFTARLWDLSGNQIVQFSGHQDGVNSVSFSPNGEYIATASDDSTARLWDLSGNQIAEFSGHEEGVTSVSFSPNGEYIATASRDDTARLWDLSGNQIAEFSGHQEAVMSVSFSPNGEYIATASADSTARLWDLSGNQIVQFSGHQEGVRSVSFSPNGQYIATASHDHTARLWDLSGNQIVQFSGHRSVVWSVSFSPNGEYIATASHDRTARLWDLSGNQIVQFSGHRGGVNSVSFSPNGEYVATASDDRTARLWDLSGNQIVQFSGHQDGVNSVSFSPNGEYIATASYDDTARLWDLSGNQIAEFSGHQRAVMSVSFSPNGEYIATASYENTAWLWDLSGNQIAEFSGHEDAVNSVSFSPNGEYIATASYDRTAQLWDLSGNQIAEFSGHQHWVTSVSFSPNGEYIATASSDSTARLWDLSGNQIAEFSGHRGGVMSVSFSPNGEYVATASRDRTARLWRVEGLDRLLARGCEWLKYYLASRPAVREKLHLCGLVGSEFCR